MKLLRTRELALLTALALILSLVPITFAASVKSDDGFIAPIEDPDASATRISTPEELAAIKDNMYGSYVLVNDIDMSGYGNWTPIGTSLGNPFKGKFDGQGHKITGLTVNNNFTSGTLLAPSHGVGLFGICDGAEIKNVELRNVDISISNSSGYTYAGAINGPNVYAGSILGYGTNSTIIYNCHSSGTVKASVSGESQATSFAGGLAGYLDTAIISYSYNECAVNTSGSNPLLLSCSSYCGGLVGYVNTDGIIDHSYNSGEVIASVGDSVTTYSGGLVGMSNASTFRITDSYNDGFVSAQSGESYFGGGATYAGGIAGYFSGTIHRVYNGGSVTSLVKDSLGMFSSANAYAGGICGQAGAAEIMNTAVVHSTAAATAQGTGSAYQYRIAYGNAAKENNVTVSTVTSGSQNDANIIKNADELKTIEVYRDELGWDFVTTWEMVLGLDYPQLKQVDVNSDEYIDEYIVAHLEFINGNTYKDVLSNYRWAQIYWSEENNFKSNLGKALYDITDTAVDLLQLDFGFLFEDDNLFKTILADYISDQATEESVLQLYKVEIPYELDKKYKKVKKYIEDNWEDAWGELSDEDLFWLFHYQERTAEEWINSDFEKHISEIVYETRHSGETLEEILGITTETLDAIIKEKKNLDNTIDWFNDLITYSGHVAAYVQADEEFKAILEEMCNHLSEADAAKLKFKGQLLSALKSYTQYNDSEHIAARMFANYVAESAVGHATDKVVDSIKGVMKEKVTNWIKSTFSEAALEKLNKIGWVADKTWKIMEYVTKNGELQECREMLKANAYFEDTMYYTLRAIESRFVTDSSFENACLFDAAFKFFKETEIASMDTVISYFDTYQTAWLPAIQHLSNTFMNSAIEQVQVNKLFLYKTYCHGVSYSLGGKVITIACPTDVYLYDEGHTLVVSIENSEVTLCAPEICAYTTDNVKIIVIPLDGVYAIEIQGTDEGSMDYSISEYDDNLENVQMTIYSDLALSTDTTYSGSVNDVLGTQPSNYNLTNGLGEVENYDEFVTSGTDTPLSKVTIENGKAQMCVGEILQLSATMDPKNATVQFLIWKSSDTKIATVSEDGQIIALSEGTVDITVQSVYGGISDTIAIVITTQPEIHTITFDPNGGILTSEATMDTNTEGKLPSLPTDPTFEGHTFVGWFTSIEGGERVTTATVFSENTTIYAHWTQVGHNFSSEWSHDENNHWHDCTDPDCNEKSGLQAHQWDTGVETEAPTYDREGTKNYTCTVCQRIKTESIPKLGHNFSAEWAHDADYHWHECTEQDCSETFGKAAHTWNDGEITIEPSFEASGVKTYTCNACGATKTESVPQLVRYTITFNANGGTLTDETTMTTDENGKLASLPIPTRGGYTFDGWYTATDGGTKVTTDTIFTENTIIYAHWTEGGTPSATYTITYDSNGGTGTMTNGTATQGQPFTLPSNEFTAPSGQRFKAWLIGTTEYQPGDKYTFTASTTVKAVWENIAPETTYTVTVNASPAGGGSVTGGGDYDEGESVTVKAVANSGYRFVRWTEDGAEVSTDASYTFTAEADRTLTAVFTRTGGGGGGGSSTPSYQITVPTTSNGTVSVTSTSAKSGTKVTVTATPNSGYKVGSVTVRDASGNTVVVTSLGNNQYSFTMPSGKVTVDVTFVPIQVSWTNPFTDVSESDWFYDGVAYVAQNGLMQGVGGGKFNPSGTTTRGMIVTILYRLENEPTVSQPTFTDVASGQYYTDAVAWAAANKIVEGYGNNIFGPNDDITREQMATILYRYADYKGYDVSGLADLSSYTDQKKISSWALVAMRWANRKGLITGRTTITLVPEGTATRAEAAVILARFCQDVAGLE